MWAPDIQIEAVLAARNDAAVIARVKLRGKLRALVTEIAFFPDPGPGFRILRCLPAQVANRRFCIRDCFPDQGAEAVFEALNLSIQCGDKRTSTEFLEFVSSTRWIELGLISITL